MYEVEVCLIVEGTYPLELGGISTWCDALLRGLPERSFALVRVGDPLPEDASTWPFEPPSSLRHWGHVCPPNEAEMTGMVEWARQQASSLPRARVYQGVAAGYAGLLAMEAARSHAGVFVLSEHASYVRELSLGNLHLESGGLAPGDNPIDLFGRVAQRLRRGADVVTCLERQTAREQRVAGAQRVHVIPNGVRVRAPMPPARRARPLALFLGRLHPLKGPDVLLDALKSVPELRVDVEFAGPLQGEPCWRAELMQAMEAEPRANWVGAVGSEHLAQRMPELLVVPSRSEAQPLVVLEAMMVGVPVLAMDVGDCGEMLESGTSDACGLVVADTQALARELAMLVHDPDVRSRLGACGRSKALRDHTQREMVERFDALYEEFCL